MQPFRTLTDEDWNALSPNLPEPGMIRMMVFVTRKSAAPNPADPTKKEGEEGNMKLSRQLTLRGLTKTKAMQSRSSLTLEQLKFNLNQASNRVVPRGGFTGKDPGYEEVRPYADLPNRMMVEDRYIRYCSPKSQ